MLNINDLQNIELQNRVRSLLNEDDIDDDIYNFEIAQTSLTLIDIFLSSVNTNVHKFITVFENRFSIEYTKDYYEKCRFVFHQDKAIRYVIFNKKHDSPYDIYCPSTKEFMQRRTITNGICHSQCVISVAKDISWL